jgi:drug/metabolite transporter (DMT)-like permease
MTEVSFRIPALQNGKIIVPVAAGLCLILQTVVLKNVLQVPAERLSSDFPLYIFIYMGIVITFPFITETEPTEPMSRSRTMLWVLVFVILTLAIIGFYAI